MQILSQLSHFPNSNNDHCDLGFTVIACDVVKRAVLRPRGRSGGFEVKRGGGVCGPPLTQVRGRRGDQLMLKAGGGGGGLKSGWVLVGSG